MTTRTPPRLRRLLLAPTLVLAGIGLIAAVLATTAVAGAALLAYLRMSEPAGLIVAVGVMFAGLDLIRSGVKNTRPNPETLAILAWVLAAGVLVLVSL
ncbi:hypothetical protein [Nonomuraea recticatena]|uniref:Uncharacterized protein n=1 Tax=Nonomuraea recticatena TaxID=46178 RepID=A0ABN3RPG9_9ACTN